MIIFQVIILSRVLSQLFSENEVASLLYPTKSTNKVDFLYNKRY